MPRKMIRPLYTTSPDPSEYDIDEQVMEVVKIANKRKACFLEIDVGKFYGLYLAWKRLKEEKKARASSRKKKKNHT